jgi:cell wall-associated NlpC family hydrolase
MRALFVCLCVLLCSCSLIGPRARLASAPPASAAVPPPPADVGAAIADAAAEMIGTPYEFGGADLGGFDCSGLALYAYEKVGISIPRTAAQQQRAARPVPLKQLRPGDLVFFRMRAHEIDHVGIYVGAGRFVHAPHQGVAVSSAHLSDAFYAGHLVNAGRFWSGDLSSP